MNKKTISDFNKMIDVNTPIIYIQDYDFVRVDELIANVVGRKAEIVEWNPGTGQIDFKTKEAKGNDISLEEFLAQECKREYHEERSFFVLRDIQDYIEQPGIKTLLQLISQRKLYDRDLEESRSYD